MTGNNTHVEEHEVPSAVLGRRSRFSVVWVLPIIAAALGIMLAYESLSRKGPRITILFDDITGLVQQSGQDLDIKYKGIVVGQVDSMRLDHDLNKVVMEARLDKAAARFACQGSLFWIVSPRVSLAGISGLSTIVSGSYLQVAPGHGEPKKEFVGLKSPPDLASDQPGLEINLTADRLGSLKRGSPVYYREFEVGQVQSCELAGNARSIKVLVHINKDYAPLVRKNTIFWNASGIFVDASLLGVKISTESLESLLVAGIAFATPEDPGKPAVKGDTFLLHDRPKEHWLKWSPGIPLKPDSSHKDQQ